MAGGGKNEDKDSQVRKQVRVYGDGEQEGGGLRKGALVCRGCCEDKP